MAMLREKQMHDSLYGGQKRTYPHNTRPSWINLILKENSEKESDGTSSTSQTISRRGKRGACSGRITWSLIATSLALLILVVASVPVILYFLEKDEYRYYKAEANITLQGNYNSSLGNLSDPVSMAFQESFCQVLTDDKDTDLHMGRSQEGNYAETYKGCLVNSISDGSILVAFTMFYQAKETVTSDNVKTEIETFLRTSPEIKISSSFNVTIVTDSLQVNIQSTGESSFQSETKNPRLSKPTLPSPSTTISPTSQMTTEDGGDTSDVLETTTIQIATTTGSKSISTAEQETTITASSVRTTKGSPTTEGTRPTITTTTITTTESQPTTPTEQKTTVSSTTADETATTVDTKPTSTTTTTTAESQPTTITEQQTSTVSSTTADETATTVDTKPTTTTTTTTTAESQPTTNTEQQTTSTVSYTSAKETTRTEDNTPTTTTTTTTESQPTTATEQQTTSTASSTTAAETTTTEYTITTATTSTTTEQQMTTTAEGTTTTVDTKDITTTNTVASTSIPLTFATTDSQIDASTSDLPANSSEMDTTTVITSPVITSSSISDTTTTSPASVVTSSRDTSTTTSVNIISSSQPLEEISTISDTPIQSNSPVTPDSEENDTISTEASSTPTPQPIATAAVAMGPSYGEIGQFVNHTCRVDVSSGQWSSVHLYHQQNDSWTEIAMIRKNENGTILTHDSIFTPTFAISGSHIDVIVIFNLTNFPSSKCSSRQYPFNCSVRLTDESKFDAVADFFIIEPLTQPTIVLSRTVIRTNETNNTTYAGIEATCNSTRDISGDITQRTAMEIRNETGVIISYADEQSYNVTTANCGEFVFLYWKETFKYRPDFNGSLLTCYRKSVTGRITSENITLIFDST